MSKVIPINSADGLAPRFQHRVLAEATDELFACTMALTDCVQSVSRAYSGGVAVRSLARFIGHLPPELRFVFEVELAAIPLADGSYSHPGYSVPVDDIGLSVGSE
jgi:hypothetical protein